jgi:mono/diheme cytochrome c family protein
MAIELTRGYFMSDLVRALFVGLAVSLATFGATADQLPGLAQLSGAVTVPKPVGQLAIYALNTDKNVGYLVYVVDGRYRAVNMFPGHYDVTLRGTIGQKNWGLTQQTDTIELTAGQAATLDFALNDPTIKPVYVGGLSYDGWSDLPFDEDKPVAKPVAYDQIYPPGRPREIIESICMGCHTASFLSYGAPRTFPDGRPVHDKDGWAITVDRMLLKRPYMDGKPVVLSKKDRADLIDYLNKNFGVDSEPRAVLQENDPPLDPAVLAKAQFIEYRLDNTKEFPKRSTHHVAFNPDGTIWTLDRGSNGPGRGLMWVDPSTGDKEFWPDNGEGEPVIAEWVWADVDGSAWYAGLRHFDRATGRVDIYKLEGPNGGQAIGVSTGIFDSNGDMWFTSFGAGIGKWIRAEDTIVHWEVPLYLAGPYGIALDSKDRVWFAEGGTNGVGMFDPKTQKFRH